jgi:hypothetical protein
MSLFPIIEQHYLDKCTYTQRDIKRKLNDQGIDVSLRTINTILKKNKITRKRMKYRRQSKNLTKESKAIYNGVYNDIINFFFLQEQD